VWQGVFVSGEEYRAVLTRLLDFIASRRGCRLLADMRNMPVMSPEDQAWVQDVWMPRSLAIGLRYSAIIAPKKAVTRSTIRHIVQDAGNIERTRAYFDTVEEAKAWLKSVPDPR
jgi:hypothetical protein